MASSWFFNVLCEVYCSAECRFMKFHSDVMLYWLAAFNKSSFCSFQSLWQNCRLRPPYHTHTLVGGDETIFIYCRLMSHIAIMLYYVHRPVCWELSPHITQHRLCSKCELFLCVQHLLYVVCMLNIMGIAYIISFIFFSLTFWSWWKCNDRWVSAAVGWKEVVLQAMLWFARLHWLWESLQILMRKI